MTKLRKKSNVVFKNIPNLLKKQKQWSCWNFAEGPNDSLEPTPQTINRKTVTESKSPGLFFSYDECKKHAHEFDGIGLFIHHNDPFMVWRMGDCCDKESGFINDKANKLLTKLNSYSEYSITGKGLKIIVRPSIPFLINIFRIQSNFNTKSGEVLSLELDMGNVSVSNNGTFVPITGNQVPGTPNVVRARKKRCEKLIEAIPPAMVLRNSKSIIRNISNITDSYLDYMFMLLRYKKQGKS